LARKYRIFKDVPFDRRPTKEELADITNITIEDVPGADIFARKSGVLLTPQQQLQNFRFLEKITGDDLRKYLKTRGLKYDQKKEQATKLAEDSMKREANEGAFFVKDPNDGWFEKRRIAMLVNDGVLTYTNAPGLVPALCPSEDDVRWRRVDIEDFKGCHMPDLTREWHDFHYGGASTSAQYRKVHAKFAAGRAWDCKSLRINEFLYVLWYVDHSMRKQGNLLSLLVFETSVGRDVSTETSLVSAKCYRCVAGQHHPCCSHILTSPVGLERLMGGTLKVGDAGDGARNWGRGKKRSSSHVPVQPVENIALRTKSSNYVGFTGRRLEAPELEPVMPQYVEMFQELASPGTAKTIVEYHNFVEGRRGKERTGN
jgi:hypothetical protein